MHKPNPHKLLICARKQVKRSYLDKNTFSTTLTESFVFLTRSAIKATQVKQQTPSKSPHLDRIKTLIYALLHTSRDGLGRKSNSRRFYLRHPPARHRNLRNVLPPHPARRLTIRVHSWRSLRSRGLPARFSPTIFPSCHSPLGSALEKNRSSPMTTLSLEE